MLGYTSVGCGASIVDIRLNCLPEVTLHRLRAPAAPAAPEREPRPVPPVARAPAAGFRASSDPSTALAQASRNAQRRAGSRDEEATVTARICTATGRASPARRAAAAATRNLVQPVARPLGATPAGA